MSGYRKSSKLLRFIKLASGAILFFVACWEFITHIAQHKQSHSQDRQEAFKRQVQKFSESKHVRVLLEILAGFLQVLFWLSSHAHRIGTKRK